MVKLINKILLHKRAVIESVNNHLKNVCQRKDFCYRSAFNIKGCYNLTLL
ncbi:MAG: hypothetical protein AB3A66_03875 [Nodularia sp. CChRGM 3473]